MTLIDWDWTPEQLENAQRYGICRQCGLPREPQVSKDEPPMISLGCPNGHSQE